MAGSEEDSEILENTVDKDSQQEQNADRSERVVKIPMARIKSLMKWDPDVTLASQEAVVAIAKATELFVGNLAKEAYLYTAQGKRKTVQKKDLEQAIDSVDGLAFLEGALES
ncbi:DNA polymerase epsilon subunit 4 [Lingula anatina]|uniref:DNA polymerase epsilon subunit 4 n=1 Tax=Lingula anatina TaxID=7574 RepID=A0A1S3KDS9_LINAN|nr:DNA polymerase epsilon subunit 4 [Lingula anatina]|eukprot:XP_013420783.1 DNA polymerase epsilon subunit 4 [Lingula anatina]